MAGNRKVSDQRDVPRRPSRKSFEELAEKVEAIRASGNETLMKILEDALEAAYRLVQYSQTEERVNPAPGRRRR